MAVWWSVGGGSGAHGPRQGSIPTPPQAYRFDTLGTCVGLQHLEAPTDGAGLLYLLVLTALLVTPWGGICGADTAARCF